MSREGAVRPQALAGVGDGLECLLPQPLLHRGKQDTFLETDMVPQQSAKLGQASLEGSRHAGHESPKLSVFVSRTFGQCRLTDTLDGREQETLLEFEMRIQFLLETRHHLGPDLLGGPRALTRAGSCRMTREHEGRMVVVAQEPKPSIALHLY